MSYEHALLWAIVHRAVLDVSEVGLTKIEIKRHSGRARAWLFRWKDWETEDPFTFPWICLHLGICPHHAKKRIKRILNEGQSLADGKNYSVNRLATFFANPSTATNSEVYNL